MKNIFDAIKWDKKKIYFLDTETTGLQNDDEVLSLSIINFNNDVMFNNLIKPVHRLTWSRAQKLHGITPEDVANKQTLVEYEKELEPFFTKDNLIVGYNVLYDVRLLKQSGASLHCDFFDVMEAFSAVYGELNRRKLTRRNCKLSLCADHYKYERTKFHSSLEDAKVTLHCYKNLIKDEKVIEYWKEEIKKTSKKRKEDN